MKACLTDADCGAGYTARGQPLCAADGFCTYQECQADETCQARFGADVGCLSDGDAFSECQPFCECAAPF